MFREREDKRVDKKRSITNGLNGKERKKENKNLKWTKNQMKRLWTKKKEKIRNNWYYKY